MLFILNSSFSSFLYVKSEIHFSYVKSEIHFFFLKYTFEDAESIKTEEKSGQIPTQFPPLQGNWWHLYVFTFSFYFFVSSFSHSCGHATYTILCFALFSKEYVIDPVSFWINVCLIFYIISKSRFSEMELMAKHVCSFEALNFQKILLIYIAILYFSFCCHSQC